MSRKRWCAASDSQYKRLQYLKRVDKAEWHSRQG